MHLRHKFILISLLTSGLAHAEIPSRPLAGIRDDAQILSLPILKAAEKVLIEHQRLTYETLYILTLSHTPKEGIREYADQVFNSWRSESPRPTDTVLLLVDQEAEKLWVQVGIGLDPTLSADRIRQIQDGIFSPEWAAAQSGRALILSLSETLRALGSPLSENGEVIRIFESAGFQGGWEAARPRTTQSFWWLYFLTGLAVVTFVLIRVLAVEVHYTALGWVRVSAWERMKFLRKHKNKSNGEGLITGGGVSGSY